MNQTRNARWRLVATVTFAGTMGPLVRMMNLPSSIMSIVRGIIGAGFLLFLMLLQKKRPSLPAIRKNLPFICLSGAFLGLTWVSYFESVRHTTIACTMVCYNMAPIFVSILAPILLHEKGSPRKIVCILTALVGIVFVSGILQGNAVSGNDLTGILAGLAAAVFYSGTVLSTRKIRDISPYDKTVLQLLTATIVLIPYAIIARAEINGLFELRTIALLFVLGCLYTGLVYFQSFDALNYLSSLSAIIIGYLETVVAVIVSVIFLHESMQLQEWIGAVMILGAAMISELPAKKRI